MTEDERIAEQKKKEAIEWRTKKKNANLFMLFSTLFEIVETLAIIFVVFMIMATIVFKGFHVTEGTGIFVFEILSVVIFIGGLIAGMFIQRAAARWVIRKYNLKDKLPNDVLEHYFSSKEDQEAL